MNRDTGLIFEAYKKKLVIEAVDQNHVPSLDEIKDVLLADYNNRLDSYRGKSDLNFAIKKTEEKIANIDKEAKDIKEIIDHEKIQTDKWNQEAAENGRGTYTLWDALYSFVSDTSKEVNGFRFRTTPEKTSVIQMADIYKTYLERA